MTTVNNNFNENSNSCDKTNLSPKTFNFHNISALSANALAVMQFISNSESNSNNYHNKINHPDAMTVPSTTTVDTHGSQRESENNSICYDYLSDLDDRIGEYSNELKCMNQVQINHRMNDVAVSSSKDYLVRKRLRNNNFLRRIINKTANNQCDAHAKSKDFSIDFLLSLNKI